MAYGTLHGAEASLYDLNALREEIFRGSVSVPLATADGITLTTDDGEMILAEKSLDIETATKNLLAVG